MLYASSGGTFLRKPPHKLLTGVNWRIHLYGISFYLKRQWDACCFPITSYGTWGNVFPLISCLLETIKIFFLCDEPSLILNPQEILSFLSVTHLFYFLHLISLVLLCFLNYEKAKKDGGDKLDTILLAFVFHICSNCPIYYWVIVGLCQPMLVSLAWCF